MLEGLGCIEEVAREIAVHGARIQDQQGPLIMYDDEYNQALLGDTWEDPEIQVTLDSGCVEHVMDAGDAPGYCGLESAGSKRKHHFVVGNGHNIPNNREVHFNLDAGQGPLQAIFQVVGITRPLMSASKICDQGLRCIFDDDKAVVTNKQTGAVVCEFQRSGGLYVATMTFKRPNDLGKVLRLFVGRNDSQGEPRL